MIGELDCVIRALSLGGHSWIETRGLENLLDAGLSAGLDSASVSHAGHFLFGVPEELILAEQGHPDPGFSRGG